MTTLFDHAVEATRQLPPEAQDDVARVLLRLIGDDVEKIYHLSPEESTAIDRSAMQMNRDWADQ